MYQCNDFSAVFSDIENFNNTQGCFFFKQLILFDCILSISLRVLHEDYSTNYCMLLFILMMLTMISLGVAKEICDLRLLCLVCFDFCQDVNSL